jgi:hypothetical protein
VWRGPRRGFVLGRRRTLASLLPSRDAAAWRPTNTGGRSANIPADYCPFVSRTYSAFRKLSQAIQPIEPRDEAILREYFRSLLCLYK